MRPAAAREAGSVPSSCPESSGIRQTPSVAGFPALLYVALTRARKQVTLLLPTAPHPS